MLQSTRMDPSPAESRAGPRASLHSQGHIGIACVSVRGMDRMLNTFLSHMRLSPKTGSVSNRKQKERRTHGQHTEAYVYPKATAGHSRCMPLPSLSSGVKKINNKSHG